MRTLSDDLARIGIEAIPDRLVRATCAPIFPTWMSRLVARLDEWMLDAAHFISMSIFMGGLIAIGLSVFGETAKYFVSSLAAWDFPWKEIVGTALVGGVATWAVEEVYDHRVLWQSRPLWSHSEADWEPRWPSEQMPRGAETIVSVLLNGARRLEIDAIVAEVSLPLTALGPRIWVESVWVHRDGDEAVCVFIKLYSHGRLRVETKEDSP